MAQAASNIWGAVKSGVGKLGSFLGKAASGIGDFIGLDGSFGLSGPTGQPNVGSPGAAASLLSQSLQGVPDVANGAASSIAPLGAASLSGPIADVGTGSVLDQVLGKVPVALGDNLNPGVDQLLSSLGYGSGAPAAPDAIGAGGAAASGGSGGWLSRMLGRRDPLSLALPAALIGYTAWRGNQPVEGVENLRGIADDTAAQSRFLSEGASQAMQGRVPGGAQTALDQALAAAEATIRSNYAGMGLTGSSMEAQDIANAKLRAVAAQFEIGQQLAQTGFAAASGQNQLAAGLYGDILNAETAQGSDLGEALAGFAALLAR